MQLSVYSMLTFVIFLQALLLQTVWLFIGRRARDRYLYDIMHFREPTSAMSRYYKWRVTHFVNAVLEGILFQFILVGSLVVVSILLADIKLFMDSILFVVFVMVLSFISSMQMAYRVKEINDRERRITTSVRGSTDKFGIAKNMVDDLYVQGAMGDGRVWFALYRLAQEPNPVGYIIRDVLLEKSREAARSRKYAKTDDPFSSSDKGPGIES
ncbi:MAG: hypothetical protein ACFFE6_01650 [Candidatus Thorarchaeota archaeon]